MRRGEEEEEEEESNLWLPNYLKRKDSNNNDGESNFLLHIMKKKAQLGNFKDFSNDHHDEKKRS